MFSNDSHYKIDPKKSARRKYTMEISVKWQEQCWTLKLVTYWNIDTFFAIPNTKKSG